MAINGFGDNKCKRSLDNMIADSIYSTEEQRIGTWLGKPLYRKTIEIPAFPNNGALKYYHSIVNPKDVWVDVSNSFIKSN